VPDPLSAPGFVTSAVTRQLVNTSEGQVHVRISKPTQRTSNPPLVMLHMTPLSSAMYDPLLPRLGADRLVIALDRPGFGFSDLPSRPLTMAEYADVTLQVLNALDVEQFDVLGTHTGSVEATELAFAHSTRVRRVIVVAIPAYTPAELEQRRYRFAGPPPPAEDASHLQWHWQRRFLYREPPYDLPLFQWRLVQELLAGEHVWWPYKAVFDYPMAERFAALEQPVLVLAPHDDLWEQTQRAALPTNAEFVELPHLMLDIAHSAPDEIANLVRTFLDRAPVSQRA
jgi:pimeloyl-ACP methyl ester carboxylesterase